MKLTTTFVTLMLAGCSVLSNTQQNCTILDPELALGIYRGGCKDSLADGYGEVTGTSSYRGSFLAGMKHGKGIKVMPNGDRYEGGFLYDYRDGYGVYVWGISTPWAGDRYEGEYLYDLRHGWGVFQWGNGDRYEGPWQNDLRMGPSVMEQRRTQAAKEIVQSVKPGADVCAEQQWDAANFQLIRGIVESVVDNLVQVRITEVEGGMASFMGATFTTGDLLTDQAVHWKLCDQY